jgi:hypothetical protein
MIDAIMDLDFGNAEAASLHDPGGKSKFALPPGMRGGANFSECGRYRQLLWREWAPAFLASYPLPFALWVGMNPSTAEGDVDDPTIRREVNFTKAMGLQSYVKVNVMDYRATNPKDLRDVAPCSSVNWCVINDLGMKASRIILAWGSLPRNLRRYADRVLVQLMVIERHRGEQLLFCMGKTQDGSPRHPLYLPNSATPIRWTDAP